MVGGGGKGGGGLLHSFKLVTCMLNAWGKFPSFILAVFKDYHSLFLTALDHS